ncbi:MAG: NAD-binding protein [Anaerolineae bacterium]|nr:NAD-binding protein [Anaerolineae bacterium]
MNNPFAASGSGRRRRRSRLRARASAGLRDTRLLLREFREPLLAFLTLIVGGGVLYYWLASLAGEERPENAAEAVYHVLSLVFLQTLIEDFPDAWYLQLFYFAMPVLGLGILAQGLTDFGVLFFNRRARGKEWQMALASTYRDHVILVGLGHLGYRVARYLHSLGQDLVVIDLNPSADILRELGDLGIPILPEDARRDVALEAAGVRRAKAIVLCIQDDMLNLQIAVKARKLNPTLQVVIRIFDDEFARSLEEQFGFKAMSATGIAAPTFAAAATGMDVTRPITIEGQTFSLAQFKVKPHSLLIGRTVEQIEQAYQISIVLLRRNEHLDLHPASDRRIQSGDHLAVVADPEALGRLIDSNLD